MFKEFVHSYTYSNSYKTKHTLDGLVTRIESESPSLEINLHEIPVDSLREHLHNRMLIAGQILASFQNEEIKLIADSNLEASNAFQIMFDYARVVDILHLASFEIALKDWNILVELQFRQGQKELQFKREQFEKKKNALSVLGQKFPRGEKPNNAEDAYYLEHQNQLEKELDETRIAIRELEILLPLQKEFKSDRNKLENQFLLFARGGYGRAELSFGSDIDTGYCLDTTAILPQEAKITQELIMRLEALLKNVGVDTVHQYFEVDEDLSRFTMPETIHTISSVLEGRVLVGSQLLMEDLKEAFYKVLPYEKFVRKKVEEYSSQHEPTLTSMNLKEDFGGLRTVQVPLWIFGVRMRCRNFMTANLTTQAVQENLLSGWEAATLLRGVEMANEFRNFQGLAPRFYNDGEAEAQSIAISGLSADMFEDEGGRLYLLKKNRFRSMDALDSYRLRLVEEVQRVSSVFLERILNQTIQHSQGNFVLEVHIGRREIINVFEDSQKTVDIGTFFISGKALLELMAFVSQTEYRLNEEIRTQLSEVVSQIEPAKNDLERKAQAISFNEIMRGPYSHVALETMAGIYDPLDERMPSLLSKFIPEFDRLIFLVRAGRYGTEAIHQLLFQSLAHGEECLRWLQREHPEMSQLLGGEQILALKWSLFCHGIGQLEGTPEGFAKSAESAVEVLSRLGLQNENVENLVRLLVSEQRVMVELSRTSTYQDQALVGMYEAAQRDVVNMILLFMTNLSIVRAQSGDTEADERLLLTFFEEMGRIFAEVRGMPDSSRSLELINIYLDHKKIALQSEVRFWLLLLQIIRLGIEPSFLDPLTKKWEKESLRIASEESKIRENIRILVLETQSLEDDKRLKEQVVRTLRNKLSDEVVKDILTEFEEAFDWFFSAFPNRYLIGAHPETLARQIQSFGNFRDIKARTEMLVDEKGSLVGMLVFTNNISQSHARVAYALSRQGMNLISGKVNRVVLDNMTEGFCYFIQIVPVQSENMIFPRDLEQMIRKEALPETSLKPNKGGILRKKIRVEFLGNDGKGYLVEKKGGGFKRKETDYHVISVIMRDEPFLFYRLCRAFELFGVAPQQILVTTIGNRVTDYFYLLQEDYERLESFNFVERLIAYLQEEL